MRSALDFEEALVGPEPAPAGGQPLAERLHAYSRLLALAADELAALESGDLAKRRELAEARDGLTREIRTSSSEADDDDVWDEEGDGEGPMFEPLPHQLASLLEEVLEALELHEEEERRMQDRWSSLEEDALKAIHGGGRIVSLRSGRYPERPPLDARLDVRF